MQDQLRLRRGHGRRQHAHRRVRDRAQRPERAARVDRAAAAEPATRTAGGPGESILDPYDRRPSRAFRPLRAGRAGRRPSARGSRPISRTAIAAPASSTGLREAATSLAFVDRGPCRRPPGLRDRVLAAARAERQNVVPLRPRRSLAVSVAARCRGRCLRRRGRLRRAGRPPCTTRSRVSAPRSRVLRDPLARHIPLREPGQLVVAPSGEAVLTVAPAEAAEGEDVRGVGRRSRRCDPPASSPAARRN